MQCTKNSALVKIADIFIKLVYHNILKFFFTNNRDYKEHGGKKREEPNLRKDNSTASTPSLSINLR